MAAGPRAAALTGGLECIWPDAEDRCYTELERSDKPAAPTVGPWAWPGDIDFTAVGRRITFSIFSRAGQFGMELVRANVRDTPKRPDTDAVALSFASCSTEEERSTGAIAMHSNVHSQPRALAGRCKARRSRARRPGLCC
jgi:hypothetical protein